MITITADDIRRVHEVRFSDTESGEAALTIASGEVVVMPINTAHLDRDVTHIITTATEVWDYCQGELSDELAAQLAADLTRELAEDTL